MDIRIPEGLEDRLLSCIDQWEQEERAHKVRMRRLWYATVACLAVIMLGGVSLYVVKKESHTAERHITGTPSKSAGEGKQVPATSADGIQPIISSPTKPIGVAEYCAELEEVNVSPDYELDEISIQTQPVSVSMEETDPQEKGQIYLIDPARYSDEGVQLNEIIVNMYN